MTLPVAPPLVPMLGRRAETLPTGDVVYEPKWDGFRCLAFRDGSSPVAALESLARHPRFSFS